MLINNYNIRCEGFFQYLYSNKFTLFTDSQPLVSIFSLSKIIPVISSTRRQCYVIYLQTFQYNIFLLKINTEHVNVEVQRFFHFFSDNDKLFTWAQFGIFLKNHSVNISPVLHIIQIQMNRLRDMCKLSNNHELKASAFESGTLLMILNNFELLIKLNNTERYLMLV